MEAPPCCRAPALLVSIMLLLLLRLSPTLSAVPVPVSRTIVVDQRGGGDFERVQPAVNAVPDGNREWVRIHVRNGSYWEKGFILLQGDGSWNTAISFNGHAPAPNGTDDDLILTALANGIISNGDSRDGDNPTIESATFTVLTDDFAAHDIAFRNTYNAHHKDNARRALAALIGGDRSSFRRCGFYGFQDTLCAYKGRHYFQSCSINGGVDFIFGYGQSIYDGCSVVSNVPPAWGKQAGFVTAHARVDGSRPGGLVFRGGQVLGTGRQYLGRAWNRFATVVFYKGGKRGKLGMTLGMLLLLRSGVVGSELRGPGGCHGRRP
ncbi:hypothetical protein BRADI_1g19360v3 [Brachypodium distachyon]|uniref:pectinesterase n=1 Tax=Brachypodium distachyon TaxID=15368 RepID=A0A0Q3JS82_BRADI|nr:hypothetical protein BRADI_1g19360v3 [Brachypodium distachyon]